MIEQSAVTKPASPITRDGVTAGETPATNQVRPPPPQKPPSKK